MLVATYDRLADSHSGVECSRLFDDNQPVVDFYMESTYLSLLTAESKGQESSEPLKAPPMAPEKGHFLIGGLCVEPVVGEEFVDASLLIEVALLSTVEPGKLSWQTFHLARISSV